LQNLGIKALGAARVVAIGSGANDAAMLQQAALGIAVLGGGGLAMACLAAADIVVPSIESALDLLLYPRRLIAMLRA
jgi:soluble P-type ATPase